jgi:hypothetical protein
MRIGLVACGKTKRDRATPAHELYISTLFHKASAYAAETYDRWYILSAKHHLLEPDQLIAPYDDSLKGRGAARRKEWASEVCEQICKRYPPNRAPTPEFYLHAGADYSRFLADCLRSNGYVTHVPLAGLGIGQQLHWYSVRGY